MNKKLNKKRSIIKYVIKKNTNNKLSMGNTSSYSSNQPQPVQDVTINAGPVVPPAETTTSNENQSQPPVPNTVQTASIDQPVAPVVQVAPVVPVVPVAPVVSMPTKRKQYVHPLIELVLNQDTENKMIDWLQSFVGTNKIATGPTGNPIYEVVDQMDFVAPVLELFSYCASNKKMKVVQWLYDNFVPLNVSYDGNFCYNECLKWNNYDMADMIAKHESFNPTMDIFENLLSRNKYDLFKKCMASPFLKDDMFTYRFTFMHYVDTNQYSAIRSLLEKIKKRQSLSANSITDQVYPNPRLPKPVEQQPSLSASTEPVEVVIDSSYQADTSEGAVEETVEEAVEETVEETVVEAVEEAVEGEDGLRHRNIPETTEVAEY